MQNPNDTIEDRIRDLPACNAVPQQTAPHARKYISYLEGDISIGKPDVSLFVDTVSKG